MRVWRRDHFAAGFSAALGAALLLLLLYLLWRVIGAASDIAAPFIASFVVALLLEPLVYRLQRNIGWLHNRRLPAVLLVYLLFLSGFIALLIYLIPTLISQGSDLGGKMPGYVASVRAFANAWLHAHHKMGPFRLPPNIDTITARYSDKLNQALQAYAGKTTEIILGSLSGLLTVILVPIITFYLLIDLHRLQARFLFLLPDRFRAGFQHTASDVGGVFGNYIRGILVVSSVYGVVATGVFFAFGLRSYALLLGFAAGVLYAVPYLGPITTAFLAGVVSLATGHSVLHTLLLLAVVLLQNQIFDNVVVPRVVGDSVGLHPLMTIFALFLGGELFGIWGMLLSVPVAASIQVVLFRIYPKLCAATPVAMTQRYTSPGNETITRNADQADAAAPK